MESLALIGAITSLGYYLGNSTSENIRNVEIEDEILSDIPLNQMPPSTNIYNSNMVESANNDVLKKSLQNYKDAEDPSITGILPPIYNSYSMVGNLETGGGNLQEITDIYKINREVDVNTGVQPVLPDRPMFQPILQMGDPTISQFSNFGQNFENEQVSLLTGKTIEKSHANMVPFFGGNTKQNVEHFTNEAKLDNFTGNTSTFFHKSAPLQRFEKRPENIYGTPLLTDNIDMSRFIPSRFKQGEKISYEEKVAAPIAFTEQNPVTKASLAYPTIDQLRTANKPQISYQAKTNAGKSIFNARGEQGAVAKNRVDTSFELGNERFFKGPGQIVGNKSSENYNQIQQTSRQDQNLEYYGGAMNSEALASQQRISRFDNTDQFVSLLQDTKRNQLTSDTMRNANSVNSPYVYDYGKSSVNHPELERDTTSKFHSLNVNQSRSGNIIGHQDNARNTLKETTVELVEPYRNVKSGVIKIDSNTGITSWKPKITGKETLIFEHKGQANKKDGMGYTVSNYDAKTTHKESTLNIDYNGHASGVNKDSMVYSTYDDPIKVRNALHTENYQGPGINTIADAENREKYYNAEISVIKEKALQGERTRGTNSAFGKLASGHNLVGDIKTNDNLLLKESTNTRVENTSNISNNIPNVIGDLTQQNFHNQTSQKDTFSSDVSAKNNRFNADLISSQLNQNPFYNLKK